MFAYPCPYCSEWLTAPHDRVGQRTLCPKCLRPLVIPEPTDGADGFDPPDAGPRVDGPTATIETLLPSDDPPESEPAVAVTFHSAPAEFEPPPGPDAGFVPLVPAPPVSPTAGPAEAVARLMTRLATRLPPPPEPPAEVGLAAGAWVALTALAAGLWLLGAAVDPGTFPFVAVVGGLQAGFGYLWAAYLVARRHPVRGLVTLFPPVAVIRLVRPFEGYGYWPLAYVLGGLAFLALGLAGPAVRH